MEKEQTSKSVPLILIVDDVETNRFVLRDIIAEMGYRPVLTENGLQALKIVERHRPQLIILDVAMPQMDGYEFCQIMKQNANTRDIPIIFISAFDEPEDIVVSCIAENYENKLVQECDPTIARFLGRVESHENQSKYIQWMEEHEAMSFSENDDISEIFDKIYVSRMESYEDLIKNVIENYIELSQISLSELDSAYGNLNFIFANKSIRLKAYNEIYDKIRTIIY